MEQSSNRFTGKRGELIARMFPHGIPTLWCPLLAYYARDGSIDKARMRKHLDFYSFGSRVF
jgi:hypothetical protein